MDMIVALILFGTILVFAFVVWAIRYAFYLGYLRGMDRASHQLIAGMSRHYEKEGEELPEGVAKAVDQLTMRTQKATTFIQKIYDRMIGLGKLGDEMGGAAWSKGFDAGQGFMEARDGEIRVDLTEKELLQLSWLAHYGFENMIPNFSGDRHFSGEEDAHAAARAVDKLERAVPRKYRGGSGILHRAMSGISA